MIILRRLAGGSAYLAATDTKTDTNAWQLSRVLCLLLVSVWATMPSAAAQVTADGTLATTVTSSDSQNFTIENGDRTGNNLFHSFDTFSIPTNGSAVFNNPTDIETIFNRVTGANVSNIDGLIQTNGTANLFLLNPNGILFGENASLDIGGSFLATTADSILFSDNVEFSATDTAPAPLLTLSTPIGLRWATKPSPITVEGTGYNLELDQYWPAFSFLPSRDNRPVGLHVNSGQTLGLIGGDILINGGNLTANQGRIELGSVAQSGTVSLIPTADGFTADYAAIDRFGDLRFTQAASVDVSGEGSGNVYFQAGTIAVLESSSIISNVLGADPGGNVRVRASDSVDIIGPQDRDLPSAFFNEAEEGSIGNVGNVSIETGRLQIVDSAFISNVSISGGGDGGDLTITANEIEIQGDTRPFDNFKDYFQNFYSTGLFMGALSRDTDQEGEGLVDAKNPHNLEGNPGNITLDADILRIVGDAEIISTALGQGNGGSINIHSQEIDIPGDILLSPGIDSVTFGEGTAGAIALDVDTLRVAGGARIRVRTFGPGDGAPITIHANEIELTGSNPPDTLLTAIVSVTTTIGTGNAGPINLDVGTLRVMGGAQILGSTFGQGTGSSITIQANNIELAGVNPSAMYTSGIFVSTQPGAVGNAGTVDIQVEDRLQVTAGARITASTAGSGNAGDIFLQANELEVSGVSNVGERNSQIEAFSTTEFDAGTIDIAVEELRVTDQGLISVSSRGQGDAGNLAIRADQIWLTDGGALQSEVAAGSQGNIILNADSLLFLRQGALISTNATNGATGGNITLTAPVILGLDNSDIVANAVQGDGGNIDITTQALLGLQFRDFLTPENDITASSQAGIDGIVQIQTPDFDPSQGTVELPSDLTDPSHQISTGCLVATNNSFVVSGGGSLPDTPRNLNSSSVWEDLRPLETDSNVNSATLSTPGSYTPLIEATEMSIAADGLVELVARSETGGSPNQISCGGRS